MTENSPKFQNQASQANHGLGFQPYRDPRNFMAWQSPLRVEATDRRRRFWPMGTTRLDQNGFPHCVAYAGAHFLISARPQLVLDYSNALATSWYPELQRRDPWPGEDYDGTSGSAFAKYARENMWIESFYHAYDITTVKNMLLERCAVMCGVTWTNSMFNSDEAGVIKVNYGSGVAGGHEILVNAIDLDRDFGLGDVGYIRFLNSWGSNVSTHTRGSAWGYKGKGYGFLSIRDLTTLLEDDGEMLIITPTSM